MKFSSKTLWGGLFVFLSAQVAQATVLMLDLNYNEKEVEVARTAAAARKEPFILLPTISDEQRRGLYKAKQIKDAIDQKVDILHDQLDKMIASSPEVRAAKLELSRAMKSDTGLYGQNSSEYEHAREHYLKVRNVIMGSKAYEKIEREITNLDSSFEFDKLAKKVPSVTVKDIENAMLQAKRSGSNVSALVFSGHHVAPTTYGDTQEGFNDQELFSMFSHHLDLLKSINAIYLWGCNTLNAEQVAEWKSGLPNARVMVGWDASAPHQTRTIDTAFLKTMMENEKKLSAETDQKKIKALFHSIQGINTSNAAICIGETIYGNHGTESATYTHCTSEEISNSQKAVSEYEKYLDAQTAGYENIPKDEPGSALRNAYTQMNRTQQCLEVPGAKAGIAPAIRLVHYPALAYNFSVYYKEGIEGANAFLKSSGAPEEAFLPDFSDPQLTRLEALKRINAFSKYAWAQRVRPDPAPHPPSKFSSINNHESIKLAEKHENDEKIDLLHKMAKRSYKILNRCRCTNEDWMEKAKANDDLHRPDQACIDE